jgi:acetyl-CoA acetyltransferase
MAATAIKGALAQVPQLSVTEIEDVICGCGLPEGPSGMNVARVATLAAGLPETVAATTVNRFCSSGLQAIGMAAHQIINEGASAAKVPGPSRSRWCGAAEHEQSGQRAAA